jgi:hypothetical protein
VLYNNFCAVPSMAKLLHACRRPSVLLKIDITKAFDTVHWAFLLELLSHLGFLRRWNNRVSVLLWMASIRILLNGHPGHRICHAPGLRQEDPLSPLLFVLSMEVLNALVQLADSTAQLSPLRAPSVWYRVSLYVDMI